MSHNFEYYLQKDDSIMLFVSDEDLTEIALQHWEAMIVDEGLSAAIETVMGGNWQEAEINIGVYNNTDAILSKLKSDPDVILAAQDDAIDIYKEQNNA